MRARYFGVLLLLLVGVVPLAVAGWLVIRRAQATALEEVRRGNRRVAERAARRLDAYLDSETRLLATLAASLSASVKLGPGSAEQLLRNYRIMYPHLRTLEIVGADCTTRWSGASDGYATRACGQAEVDAALAGRTWRSPVRLADDFALLMTLAIPLDVAGERVGALVADVDLVGLWPAVDEIRVGRSGRARLVSADDTLIAHGDPEERRRVFLRDKDPFAARVRAAPEGTRYRDSQGRDVLAVGVTLPQLGWTVIVEEPTAAALHASTLMRRDLLIILAVASLAALLLGLLIGRPQVRSLELLREHAAVLGSGRLDARVEVPRLSELHSLAKAMNDMADQLVALQDKMRADERLTAFSQVVAGLAHDVLGPIEAVRELCTEALAAGSVAEVRDILSPATQQDLPRLSRFVRDLRRVAQRGEVPLELSQVDPGALVREVLASVGDNPRWRGFDIAFVSSGRAQDLVADRALLARAVINLVGNAADACCEVKVERSHRVEVAVSDGEPASVTFAVRDTGVGIEPERVKKLLDYSFQSTKRSNGIGLGLTVASHVARAHGGHIDIVSTPGQGSVFQLVLPKVPPQGDVA